jgi:Pyruvate/2-oxoacid:ferredoxin oxidoreductase delta subunit
VVIVDWDVCTGCTICEKECPWNTITMVSGVEVEELLSEEVTEGV